MSGGGSLGPAPTNTGIQGNNGTNSGLFGAGGGQPNLPMMGGMAGLGGGAGVANNIAPNNIAYEDPAFYQRSAQMMQQATAAPMPSPPPPPTAQPQQRAPQYQMPNGLQAALMNMMQQYSRPAMRAPMQQGLPFYNSAALNYRPPAVNNSNRVVPSVAEQQRQQALANNQNNFFGLRRGFGGFTGNMGVNNQPAGTGGEE